MEQFVTCDLKVFPHMVRNISSKCVYKGKTHYFVHFAEPFNLNAWVNRDNMAECRDLLHIFYRKCREGRKAEDASVASLPGRLKETVQRKVRQLATGGSSNEPSLQRTGSSDDDFDGSSLREDCKPASHSIAQTGPQTAQKSAKQILTADSSTPGPRKQPLEPLERGLFKPAKNSENFQQLIATARELSAKGRQVYRVDGGEAFELAMILSHSESLDTVYFNVLAEKVDDDEKKLKLVMCFSEAVQYDAVMVRRYLQHLTSIGAV